MSAHYFSVHQVILRYEYVCLAGIDYFHGVYINIRLIRLYDAAYDTFA